MTHRKISPPSRPPLVWLRAHLLDLSVSAAVLAWILACGPKKNTPPPPPPQVPSTMGTVTYKQLEGGDPMASRRTESYAARPASTGNSGGSSQADVMRAARMLESGQHAEASKIAEDALRAGVSEPNQQALAVVVVLTGSALQGQPERGLAFMPEVEQVLSGGAVSASKVAVFTSLVTAQTLAGKHEDATRTGGRMLSFVEAEHGKDSEVALAVRLIRASSMLRAGDNKGAKQEFEQVVATSEAKLGAEHQVTIQGYAGLGAALNAQKKYKPAKEKLERARSLLVRSGTDAKALEGRIYHHLGDSNAGLKKKDLAKESYETAVALLRKAKAATPADPMIDTLIKETEAALGR